MVSQATAFVQRVALPTIVSRPSTHNHAQCSSTTSHTTRKVSRRAILFTLASAAGTLLVTESTTADEALKYTVVKQGDGPSAELGDLVGIRFKGAYNGVVFDNLFEDKTPYFYRLGSGTILKGLDKALMLMKVGDIYDLTLTGDLAFGAKGRRASAGKPSIPPNATVNYTLELTTIPGKEEELLENSDEY